MHFSNFFRFMESAEHAFFRSLGFSVAHSRCGLEVCLPRAHAECDYAVPVRFEDEVLVRLLVERKGKRSLTYQFRFLCLNGAPPQEVARGRLTVVCVERQPDGALKAVPLPKPIADQIQEAPLRLLADGALAPRATDHPAKHQKPNTKNQTPRTAVQPSRFTFHVSRPGHRSTSP